MITPTAISSYRQRSSSLHFFKTLAPELRNWRPEDPITAPTKTSTMEETGSGRLESPARMFASHDDRNARKLSGFIASLNAAHR